MDVWKTNIFRRGGEKRWINIPTGRLCNSPVILKIVGGLSVKMLNQDIPLFVFCCNEKKNTTLTLSCNQQAIRETMPSPFDEL